MFLENVNDLKKDFFLSKEEIEIEWTKVYLKKHYDDRTIDNLELEIDWELALFNIDIKESTFDEKFEPKNEL
jgi:hypothetical protein